MRNGDEDGTSEIFAVGRITGKYRFKLETKPQRTLVMHATKGRQIVKNLWGMKQ